MVAHLLWGQRVAGSNPVTPTDVNKNQVDIGGGYHHPRGWWFRPKALRRFDSGMQGQTIRFSNLIVILWRERRGPHGMKELKDAGSSPATPKGPPRSGWKHEYRV